MEEGVRLLLDVPFPRMQICRMKGKLFLTTLAVLALVSTAICSDEFKREQDLSAKEGKPAPALQVTGWMNTPEGKALDLKSLVGKVVVIDFWGTW